MAVDKVKWLQEKGPIPQFNQSIRVVVHKDGSVNMHLKEKLQMKSKQNTKEVNK